jgi:hypothetical protein
MIFEFVKKKFDEIALFIEPGCEADCWCEVRLWLDVGPTVMLEQQLGQPTGIIGTVCLCGYRAAARMSWV